MQTNRARTLIAAALAVLLLSAAPALARTHRTARCTVPKLSGVTLRVARHRIEHAHCRVGRVHRPKTASAHLIVSRQIPRAGRKVKRGARVTVWLKAKQAKVTTAPTLTAPTAPTTTTTTTQTPTAPTALTLHVSLDPSFTQNPSNPLQVTYQVSASATTGTQTVSSLPAGVLEFFSDGSLADTMNVGGTTTGGNVTVTYAVYGQHTTDVVYDSGTNSTTTGVETETVEPPALTVTDAWGTASPTTSPAVAATIVGNEASVVITDKNFEGATGIGVTDSAGGSCTAIVSGTAATCSITDLTTPTSYTLSYPGGSSVTTSVNVANGGVQQVTTTWPAETVAVDDPAVLVQRASIVECGESFAWFDVCANQPDPWPTPVTATTGQTVQLFASAQGNVASDPVGAGYLDWTISGGVEGTDYSESNLVEGSTDCSQTFQTFDLSGGGVSPDEAEGGCGLRVATVGTYTVTVEYISEDPNYPNADGPSVTVDVTGS